MIREEIVAKRYADAFLAYAKATIGFDKALEELQDAKRIVRDNPDFKEFLESVEFNALEKIEAITGVFASFSEELRNFLKLLVERGRIYLLIDIAEFARIHYAHGVEIDALLKTSYPLDTDVIIRLKDSLEKKMKKKLHLYIELDSTLIGGIYAKIGNIIIDGSMRRRLEDLREKLHVLKVA